MLYRLLLARGQTRDRAGDNSGRVGANKPLCWIGTLICMAFERERRMHLAQILSANTAEEINRAPVSDYAQPCGERPTGVVGLPRAMNSQQHVLYHVVDVVGCDATTPRNGLDDRNAVAQQRLVGGAIPSLRRCHPGRPA